MTSTSAVFLLLSVLVVLTVDRILWRVRFRKLERSIVLMSQELNELIAELGGPEDDPDGGEPLPEPVDPRAHLRIVA